MENFNRDSGRYQRRCVDEAEEILTRGDTKKCKESDTNPFCGDVIVLELLAIVRAVGGTFWPFEVWSI